MPKYIPVADKIADGLFAAKNRMFDFVQQRLNEGKNEKEIMKELKETVTADPSMLAEIEQTFFKKKAYFNPEILFSSMLYDINSLWEDGYVSQSEVNEVIDQYASLEEQINDGTISESQAGAKFDAFAETYLVNAESRQAITDQFNEGYITEDEKETRLSEVGKAKVAKFNPYRSKKASWIDDAKVGDQVELNDETGEVTYIGNDKIEVKTPTKTETIWKN